MKGFLFLIHAFSFNPEEWAIDLHDKKVFRDESILQRNTCDPVAEAQISQSFQQEITLHIEDVKRSKDILSHILQSYTPEQYSHFEESKSLYAICVNLLTQYMLYTTLKIPASNESFADKAYEIKKTLLPNYLSLENFSYLNSIFDRDNATFYRRLKGFYDVLDKNLSPLHTLFLEFSAPLKNNQEKPEINEKLIPLRGFLRKKIYALQNEKKKIEDLQLPDNYKSCLKHIIKAPFQELEKFIAEKNICFNRDGKKKLFQNFSAYVKSPQPSIYYYILSLEDIFSHILDIKFIHKNTQKTLSLSSKQIENARQTKANRPPSKKNKETPFSALQQTLTIQATPVKEKPIEENPQQMLQVKASDSASLVSDPETIEEIPNEDIENSSKEEIKKTLTSLKENINKQEYPFLYLKCNNLLKDLENNGNNPTVLLQIQEAYASLYSRYREITPPSSSIIVKPSHEGTFMKLMYTPLCYLKDMRFSDIRTLITGLGGSVDNNCAGSRIKMTLGKEVCGIHLHDKHDGPLEGGRIASLRKLFLDAGVKVKDE